MFEGHEHPVSLRPGNVSPLNQDTGNQEEARYRTIFDCKQNGISCFGARLVTPGNVSDPRAEVPPPPRAPNSVAAVIGG